MVDAGPIDTLETYSQFYDALVRDPATRYRLRTRIIEDGAVDPVDAMNDAQILLDLANARNYELRKILRPMSPDELRERGSWTLRDNKQLN